MLELDEYTDEPTSQPQTHLIIENIARQKELDENEEYFTLAI